MPSGCYGCPANMVKQCELEFGDNGMPPCAKVAANSASTNSASAQSKPSMEEFYSRY